jgi:hypothetical protein
MEMQAKVKHLKKRESTYCHKHQVLAQVGQDMRDVKLISTLNKAHIVETEKKNQQDETMKKPEKILKTKPNLCVAWIGRPLPTLQKNCEMDYEMCVLFTTRGCPKHFHTVQQTHHKPKS